MREETSPASWASYDELEIQLDTLQIPKEQVISVDGVADGIRGLPLAFVNVFAVTHLDSSWTLVDAALPFTAGLIRHWAEKHFNWPPNAIVLTHGHFDHSKCSR
jgi:glyoxylase-like metal-dependent hydrolase (beta-lactamase superfamily II)